MSDVKKRVESQPPKSLLPGEAHQYMWKEGRICYTVAGADDAPALLLLHAPGIGASAYDLRVIADSLFLSYRVYMPDLLGFGLSDHPDITYSACTYRQLVEDFLRDVVQRPAIVIASGLSANYAISVAQRYPELCSRLVLLSPVLYRGQQSRFAALRRSLWRPSPLSMFLYIFLSSYWLLRLRLALQQRTGAARTDAAYIIYASARQPGAYRAARAYLAGELALDVDDQVASLHQPVLLLSGRLVEYTPGTVHHISSFCCSLRAEEGNW